MTQCILSQLSCSSGRITVSDCPRNWKTRLTSAAVEIRNVTKTYDNLTAVDQVSLSVQQGQTLGLIGPNGAGKTTLLRLISTLAKPDSGDVCVNGHSVRESPRDVRRMLGFMPAEFGSPRSQTIGEYLQYFGCMYGISPAERPQRIREVCELTDLNGREDVMVKGLSTGNRQRLLLAKTLLHDPQLLILDEPASGLDPRARNELRAIVRTLASMARQSLSVRTFCPTSKISVITSESLRRGNLCWTEI